MNWTIAKLQTFGCEVEMNNIERRKAAEVAASYFVAGNGCFRGVPFHGHATWVARDTKGREWKFMYDGSIEGPEPEKCEMVTPVLTYDDDIELLQGLIRKLRDAGAVSNPKQDCGVHIHIGADGHDGRTLRNLVNLIASHELLLYKSIGVDPDRVRWCQTVNRKFLEEMNNKRPVSQEGVRELWYKTQPDIGHDIDEPYHRSRYKMLNFHSLRKGTVEFRLFQFDNPDSSTGKKNGLHAGKLRAYIMLALTLSQQAKEAKTISPKHVQMDNEKFAMRTWMNRMGMIGPEFKAPHEHLIAKLAGDAAWRYGRPE